MFEQWAKLYDALYAAKGKRYDLEAAYIKQSANKLTQGRRLLDVACGTGEHLRHLRRYFDVAGVDQSSAMLDVAREKLPDISLWQRDMTSFELPQPYREFDVVTCLFSAIGYLPSVDQLRQCIRTLAQHTTRDGALLLEPAVLPHRLSPPESSELCFEFQHQRVTRKTSARTDGRFLRILFEYEIGHSKGESGGSDDSRKFSEGHSLFLFTQNEYEDAFVAAGLGCQFDPVGPSGLGLFLGTHSS